MTNKTVNEHIRANILDNFGMAKSEQMPNKDELIETEWSHQFEQLMKNRLIMGAFRYGVIVDGSKLKGTKRTEYIQVKLEQYKVDGNAEHLVDIANFCLVEFREENHPHFHFSAKDDKGHMEK